MKIVCYAKSAMDGKLMEVVLSKSTHGYLVIHYALDAHHQPVGEGVIHDAANWQGSAHTARLDLGHLSVILTPENMVKVEKAWPGMFRHFGRAEETEIKWLKIVRKLSRMEVTA